MSKVSSRRVRAARQAWQAMGALVLDNGRRREVSEQVGLSFGKTRALRRIAVRPMPMRELAALLGMDPPNLTTLVDDLEPARRRRSSSGHRRACWISLPMSSRPWRGSCPEPAGKAEPARTRPLCDHHPMPSPPQPPLRTGCSPPGAPMHRVGGSEGAVV
jgi:hypothetical protein